MLPCTIEIGKGERLGWILPASQVSWSGGIRCGAERMGGATSVCPSGRAWKE